MVDRPLSRMMQRVRAILGAPAGADVSDRELLERFMRVRDEAAFETLVRRHGPLVLGVCRRVLGNVADAEDAFQATFLILARRAGSVSWNASIAGWLYQVAYHVSSRARRAAARRQMHELRAPPMTASADSASDRDLRPILDDELHRLPEKYRLPLLLCYVHGRSREEAAEELGWTMGEVKGRLERGREMLRGRLVRRGVLASGAALPALRSEEALAVSVNLVSTTVQAVFHGTATAAVSELTQGALQAMFWTKLKRAGIAAALIALLGGTGVVTMVARNGTSTAQAVPLPPPAERPAPAAEAVVKDGLSVTVTPAKRVFAEQEPIAFTVTLKNVSREPFYLFEPRYHWDWQIVVGKFWQVVPQFEAKRAYPPSTLLEPGKEIRIDVVLNPKQNPFNFQWMGPQREPVAPKTYLDPGKYPLAIVLKFREDIRKERLKDYQQPHWTGEITSKPVEIEINDAAAVAWGKPANGLRLGLSPRTLAVATDAKTAPVTVWFENVGKEEVKVQLWDELMRFHGKQKKASFDVTYRAGRRAATPAPPPVLTLKSGQRAFLNLEIPFEGPDLRNNFVGLLRPTAEDAVTLAAAWADRTDAADAVTSDTIQIALRKETGADVKQTPQR